MKPKTEWKKVPDEMPESGTDVYLYAPRFKKDYGDGVRVGYWESESETWYVRDTDSNLELMEVSHWTEQIKPDPPEATP